MAKSTEKKEEKPKYETPVVVKLDKVDKASGFEGCISGSSTEVCTAGGVASIGCDTGGAVAPG